jgi:hypothetical protein
VVVELGSDLRHRFDVAGTVAGVFLHNIEVSGIGGAAARDVALMMALLPAPDGIASLVRIGGLAVLLMAVPATLSGRRGGGSLVAGGAWPFCRSRRPATL